MKKKILRIDYIITYGHKLFEHCYHNITSETTDHISTVPGMPLYVTDTRGSNEDMTDQFLSTAYYKNADMIYVYIQSEEKTRMHFWCSCIASLIQLLMLSHKSIIVSAWRAI